MNERFPTVNGPLFVHPKEYCKSPCAFHDPMPGPWEDWPLAYETTSNSGNERIVLRVCEHGIRHPAVEQLPHWVESGHTARARHHCCGCPCVPDGVLGSDLRLLIPPSDLLAMEADEKAVDALDPGPKDLSPFIKVGAQVEQVGTEKDPNKVAADYLERIRPHLDGELHKALVQLASSHVVVCVEVLRTKLTEYTHKVSCEMDCIDHFKEGQVGTDDNDCVTLKFAILGGYVPVEWDVENDEEDDD